MTHNQTLTQAGIQGTKAARDGKPTSDNPYKVNSEHAYYSAWYVAYRTASV